MVSNTLTSAVLFLSCSDNEIAGFTVHTEGQVGLAAFIQHYWRQHCIHINVKNSPQMFFFLLEWRVESLACCINLLKQELTDQLNVLEGGRAPPAGEDGKFFFFFCRFNHTALLKRGYHGNHHLKYRTAFIKSHYVLSQ